MYRVQEGRAPSLCAYSRGTAACWGFLVIVVGWFLMAGLRDSKDLS